MVLLSSEILTHLVEDYGPNEVLRRLSDPFWFQAFGRVLGFDWHSSGVTTTVCGAVKESLREPVARGGCLPLAEKGPPRGKPPAQIAGVCDDLGKDPGAQAPRSLPPLAFRYRRRNGSGNRSMA